MALMRQPNGGLWPVHNSEKIWIEIPRPDSDIPNAKRAFLVHPQLAHYLISLEQKIEMLSGGNSVLKK